MASTRRPGIAFRFRVALGLLAGLRVHDLRAAGSLIGRMQPHSGGPARLVRFLRWAAGQMLGAIPDSMATTTFASHVSRTSVWLASENPLLGHPWAEEPGARIPDEVDVVVIGAGFTGAACAYHWSRGGGGTMAVLEMNEAASGASGRNEGVVVMGRFFAFVKSTMLAGLARTRADLSPEQRNKLASQFASAYAGSAYKNADMIERTIKEEGFECDYTRQGWVQGQEVETQATLEDSVRVGREAGFDDWDRIEPEEVLERSGMTVGAPAGFSRRAATWHPARWVWSLLSTAIGAGDVSLFTRTRVLSVEDRGDRYAVHTDRGDVLARHVINATESHSATIYPQLRGLLHPVQTQAAYAEGGPDAIKPHVAIQSSKGFFGRLAAGVIFGSDATRLSYKRAGRNRPSRFITRFLVGEMHQYFGAGRFHVTREWSCTAGFTDDEFPIIGLLDGKRNYIIAGMCGSGSAIHFNAARHIVQQVLGLDGPDDYPAEYFSPTRVLDPENPRWPSVQDS